MSKEKSNKKIFGIFNWLDLAIIAIVILAVGFAIFKIKSNKGAIGTESQTKDMYMEFFLEEVQDFVVDQIYEGDIAKDALQNNILGTVTEIEYGPSIDFNPNSQGVNVKSGKEGYVSCRIKIKTNGLMTNSGLSINSYNYYINKSIEMRFGKVALYVRISGISEE